MSCVRWLNSRDSTRAQALSDTYRHIILPSSARTEQKIQYKEKLLNLFVVAGGVNNLLTHRLSNTPLRIAPFTTETVCGINVSASQQPLSTSSPGLPPFSPTEYEGINDSIYRYRSLSKRKIDALKEQERRKTYVDCLGKFKRKLSLMLDDSTAKPEEIAKCVEAFVSEDFGLRNETVRLYCIYM